MLRRYQAALAAANAHRRSLRVPSVLLPICVVVVGLLIVVALAVIYASPTQMSSQFREGGMITKFSAALMAAAAILAGTAFFISRRDPRPTTYFWLLCALGFTYFSLDEVLQFHEYIGHLMDDGKGEGVMIFRNWNDIVVILYGIAALVVCAVFLPEILLLPNVPWLMFLALGAYAVHTGVDSVYDGRDKSVMLEESAKLFSGGFFALTFFAAVSGLAARNTRSAMETGPGA